MLNQYSRGDPVRLFLSLIIVAFGLAACDPYPQTQQTPDGLAPPKVTRIRKGQESKVQFRMLDSLNSLRSASGAGPVQIDSKLTAAAATHSRDMANQGRPWHFGSDGSSPIDRVARTGYPGIMLGEVISETYETELETLAAWMDQKDTRQILMDPQAVNMGFSWYQQRNGKIWWTLLMGN